MYTARHDDTLANFPAVLIDPSGHVVDHYTDLPIAQEIADRLNSNRPPGDLSTYDEADEMMEPIRRDIAATEIVTNANRRQLLKDVRTYRNQLQAAWNEPDRERKQRLWDNAHMTARRLGNTYGPALFARMDDIAYRFVGITRGVWPEQ